MDELHHECGIAAIYHLAQPYSVAVGAAGGQEQVSRLMPRILLDMQNRGQLAAGFSTFHPHREQILTTYKQIGTVIEAFRLNHPGKYDSIMREYAGRAAIGHVRYATCGPTDRTMPNLLIGTTAANGSGSASPSTDSWRITPSCATTCLPWLITT